MTKFLVFFGLSLMLMGAGCSSATRTKTQSASEVKIGAALALTGDAATWGEAEKNAITLAMEDWEAAGKGKKMNVLFEDTASDQAKTISAVSKLINVDGVRAILGPSWLDSYGGAAPLSDRYQHIMMTPSAAITAVKTSKEQFPNVFSTWFNGDLEASELVRYFAERGQKKVAFVLDQDSYWNDVLRQLREQGQGKGIAFVLEERAQPGTVDFRSIFAKLKATKPDAVVFGFQKEQSYLAFLKQRREMTPDLPAYSVGSVGEFMGQERFEGLFTNVYITVPRIKDATFRERYRQRFSADPIFSASNAYDATNMLFSAIERGATTTEGIRDFLRTNTFNTVTFGEGRFNEMGGIDQGIYDLMEYRDGKKQVVQKPS